MGVHYYGYSMELSGTWVFVVAEGVDTNLICNTDHERAADVGKDYRSEGLSYVPDYTCEDTHSDSYEWDLDEQYDLAAQVSEFHIHSLHRDSNDLYGFEVWVR